MDDTDTPTTAFAWRLQAYSASNGGKDYTILMVDRLVAVGFGPMHAEPQWRIHTFPSPAHAKSFALTQTAAKEKKGYDMIVAPRALSVDDTALQAIDGNPVGLMQRLSQHRGRQTLLREMAEAVLRGPQL